jgi:hypothetical protein
VAANWELQLISAVVKGDEPKKLYDDAQKYGVRYETLASEEAKNIWAKIDAHVSRPENPGYIPSLDTLKELIPTLDLPTPQENFFDICEKVRHAYLRRRTDQYVQNYMLMVRENPANAVAKLHRDLTILQEQFAVSTDMNFKESALKEIIAELDSGTMNSGITGMPWPWERLNLDTQGIQYGDFIMVWALPKSMKTWLGLVVSAHLFKQGYRVMIYSKEMTWKVVRNRIACILTGVNYNDFKRNQLSPEQQHEMFLEIERLSSAAHSGQMHFTQADRMDGSVGGPEEIRRKVEVYNPDFVMLDSSYMLEMPNAQGNALDWKNLSAVTRALKQISKSSIRATGGVAIMAIFQENEQQAIKFKNTRGTASLAMNKGAVADCDIGLRLIINKKRKELSIHYAVARECEGEGFTINAIPCVNFEYCGDHLWQVGDDYSEEAETKAGKTAAKPVPKIQAPPPVPVKAPVAPTPFVLKSRSKVMPGVLAPALDITGDIDADSETDTEGDEDAEG